MEKQINRLRQITETGKILCMHGKAVDDEVCPGCTHTLITPNDQNFVNAAKNAFHELYGKAKSVADELTEGLFFAEFEESTVGYGTPTYREPLISAHAPHTEAGMQAANVALKNAAAKYAFWGIRAITHSLSGETDCETGAEPAEIEDDDIPGFLPRDGYGIMTWAVTGIQLRASENKQSVDRVVAIYPTCDGVKAIKDWPESACGVDVELWPAPPIHKFKHVFVIAANNPFVFDPGHIRLEQNGDVLEVVASPKFSVKRPWAIAKVEA